MVAINPTALIGKWGRLDGDYVLDIENILENGKLQLAYYNPHRIHVGKAAYTIASSRLHVSITLDDQAMGYPGCIYTLAYDPSNGTLIGTYFQAAASQQYNVIFKKFE